MTQFNSFLANYFVFILLWELIWKGFALWKSARKGEKVWFILILGVNTIGFLPIFYILYDKFFREKLSKVFEKLSPKKNV